MQSLWKSPRINYLARSPIYLAIMKKQTVPDEFAVLKWKARVLRPVPSLNASFRNSLFESLSTHTLHYNVFYII